MQIEEQPRTPIDWDKPIETTEGFPARVISRDYLLSSGERQVIVQVERMGESSLHYYNARGTNRYISVKIRNRKVKREGWVNVYSATSSSYPYCKTIFPAEDEAQKEGVKHSGYITTTKIKWEECS